MYISSKLSMMAVIAFFSGLIIMLLVYWSAHRTSEYLRADDLIVSVANNVGELLVLTEDYTLYKSERAIYQWRVKCREIKKSLDLADKEIKEKRSELNDIKSRFDLVDSFMMSLIDVSQSVNKVEEQDRQRRVSRVISERLHEEMRILFSNSLRLSDYYKKRISDTYQTTKTIILFVVMLFVVAIISTSIWLKTGIIRPLNKLRRETRRIASGDFDRRIANTASDEVGDLSRSFDQMSERLQSSMVSLDKLEGLVEERTRDIQVAREKAEKANDCKSEFLSRMSHELRTPLNAIIGYARLVELDKSLSEQTRMHVSEACKASNHLLQLINEVLDIAKVDSGEFSLDISQLDIAELVTGCVALVMPMAEEKGIDIHTSVRESVFIEADSSRVRQILINLLSNAIKYNHENGRVDISLEETGENKIRLIIEDTGIGIPADQKDEVFEPFHRVTYDDDFVEGTGIGLAISRKLANTMGGEIGFTSTYGKGSQFWLELPRNR